MDDMLTQSPSSLTRALVITSMKTRFSSEQGVLLTRTDVVYLLFCLLLAAHTDERS